MLNRNLVIGALALVLIGAAFYYFFTNKPKIEENLTQQEEIVPTITPQDLGLTFTARADKKAVLFSMRNPGDIALVEYHISYTKQVNDEQVPEGLIGEVRPKVGASIAIDYRELGTCSAKVCRYDKVVSDVKLTLKISKTDGKIYQAESSLTL